MRLTSDRREKFKSFDIFIAPDSFDGDLHTIKIRACVRVGLMRTGAAPISLHYLLLAASGTRSAMADKPSRFPMAILLAGGEAPDYSIRWRLSRWRPGDVLCLILGAARKILSTILFFSSAGVDHARTGQGKSRRRIEQ